MFSSVSLLRTPFQSIGTEGLKVLVFKHLSFDGVFLFETVYLSNLAEFRPGHFTSKLRFRLTIGRGHGVPQSGP
jgi:hypothetical protein